MSRILAIDDRPINRQFLVSLLGYGGHQVLEAADGEEALLVVRESHPDLVITDINMPKMNGYEFVDRLRQENEIAGTPVIFYTASYHERDARRVADSFGVADIITKPSEPEVILKKVNAALGPDNVTRLAAAETIDVASRRELEVLQATGLKLSALVELGMELSSERDSKKLLSRFCATARHIVGARKSMLGILDEDGHSLRHFLINGLKEGRPIIGEPPTYHPVLETIVTEKKVVRINQAPADQHLELLSPYNSPIKSLLGAPLVSANKTYGWLVLLEKQNGEDYTEEDERMAITLAAAAAIAYENAEFAELLQRNSDELDRARREQLEMKDQFFSHVSHELRSPLAALHQFTTILLDGIAGELNPEQREYLEIVLKNSLQLRDMIGDLLDVTRADSGKLTVELQSLALADLMRPILQSYRAQAAPKGVELCCICPTNLPKVKADPNRIGQVFANLLENAVKFTSQGTITVSACEDRQAGFIRVNVKDTGCGIPGHSLRKIFDRLYQSPNQTTDSRKGLGLGLHICKQLVELHGGRIWAESRDGHGATFSFTLPASEEGFQHPDREGGPLLAEKD